ncbi:hypothetical protein ACQEU3_10620 [Spirillospora sp. CA-253888]
MDNAHSTPQPAEDPVEEQARTGTTEFPVMKPSAEGPVEEPAKDSEETVEEPAEDEEESTDEPTEDSEEAEEEPAAAEEAPEDPSDSEETAPQPSVPAEQTPASPRGPAESPGDESDSGETPPSPGDSGEEKPTSPRPSAEKPASPRDSAETPVTSQPSAEAKEEPAASRRADDTPASPSSTEETPANPQRSAKTPAPPRDSAEAPSSAETPISPRSPSEAPASPRHSAETPVSPRDSGQPPASPRPPAGRPASPRDSAETPVLPRSPSETPANPRHSAETPVSPHGSGRPGAAVTRDDIPLPSRNHPPRRLPPEEEPAVPEDAEPIPERALPTLDPNGQWTAQWRASEPPPAAPPARPTAEDPVYAPHDIAPFAQPEAPSYAYPAATDDRPAPEPEPEPKKRGRKVLITLVAALILVAGVVTGQLLRPVPEPSIELSLPAASHTFPGAAPVLPWPSGGQAAVAVEGLGTMGSAGGSAPIPTASVAKVMTAYVILRGHPLRSGEDGPEFTVSPQGIAELPGRHRRQESLLGITPGLRLTERKALEALMIISANDVAHELARWDSGGNVQAFVAKMNEAARSLGMAATTYTDPSGYDAGTVSTAADQVRLLTAAMKIPAFAETVAKRTYVPAAGGRARTGGNFLLGRYGVVGGKTGYTDRAGGNFVFAARKRVGGVPTTVVGAVMGQRVPGVQGSAALAVNAAQRVVAAAGNALVSANLAPAGRPIARVDDGLGGTTPLVAKAPLNVVGWPGLTVPLGVAGDPPHEAAPGERVGTVTAGAGRLPVSPSEPLEEPSLLSRLIRLG